MKVGSKQNIENNQGLLLHTFLTKIVWCTDVCRSLLSSRLFSLCGAFCLVISLAAMMCAPGSITASVPAGTGCAIGLRRRGAVARVRASHALRLLLCHDAASRTIQARGTRSDALRWGACLIADDRSCTPLAHPTAPSISTRSVDFDLCALLGGTGAA